MGFLIDDATLATTSRVLVCSQCLKLIDPEFSACVGGCHHCGYRFSQLRQMTAKEQRKFLSGKLCCKMKLHAGESIRVAERGIQSISSEDIEEQKRRLQVTAVVLPGEMARRTEALRRDDPIFSSRTRRVSIALTERLKKWGSQILPGKR